MYGDGAQLRDYVHVDDVVQAILLAWREDHDGPLIVGSGTSVSVHDLIDAARTVTGAPIPVEHVPAKQGEMPSGRARHLGGEGPRISASPRFDLGNGHSMAGLHAICSRMICG
ncbi:NAD-dependent epimerase/dehydratase family protein [Nonomuraea ferruginea]